MKFFRFIFVFIILGAIAYGAYLYKDAEKSLSEPLKPGVLNIPKGTNIKVISENLAKNNGLRYPQALEIYSRFTGKAAKIKAGDYLISAKTTPIDLLEDLVAGKVIVLQIKIVPGKKFSDLREVLNKAEHIKHETNGKTNQQIAEMLGIAGSLEGQFLPETYNYQYGDSDIAILKRMNTALKTELEQAWEARSETAAILDNPYEALILASIVEKETAVEAEREAISGVFHRRLQQKMRLQTDPSVIYGLGDKYTGKLTKTDLQTDTPYNTYTRNGLPPTPIALPSKSSIYAATNPDESENIYFVADGTGGHKFSKTYEEHQKAVKNWRKIESSSEKSAATNPDNSAENLDVIIVKPAENQEKLGNSVEKSETLAEDRNQTASENSDTAEEKAQSDTAEAQTETEEKAAAEK
ncbi:MAG: endolytic transglycosylase MltG [Cardiobacteriaceae bacterium]|nr:endolytic transglycosylase MltG [Cardiobacteriaceae bacterium]